MAEGSMFIKGAPQGEFIMGQRLLLAVTWELHDVGAAKPRAERRST